MDGRAGQAEQLGEKRGVGGERVVLLCPLTVSSWRGPQSAACHLHGPGASMLSPGQFPCELLARRGGGALAKWRSASHPFLLCPATLLPPWVPEVLVAPAPLIRQLDPQGRTGAGASGAVLTLLFHPQR